MNDALKQKGDYMLKRVCDLCGKPMYSDSRACKIKELKFSWHEFWWEKIDAHDECIKKLFDSRMLSKECLANARIKKSKKSKKDPKIRMIYREKGGEAG